MKNSDQYSHRNALEIIQSKDNIMSELNDIVNISDIKFGTHSPNNIKTIISDRFNEKGWADKVKVGRSNLTISFLKSKIGVCFQIGNVARTYADILKLMQLHHKGVIDAGVIFVPHALESKKMGANYAQYERLSKEIVHFKEIITMPVLVIGISN